MYYANVCSAPSTTEAAGEHAKNVKELGADLKNMRAGVLKVRDATREAHEEHAEVRESAMNGQIVL